MAKLYTNDQLAEGVDVELVKMNHETGEVHIKTAGGEQLVVKDSQPAPDPEPEDPEDNDEYHPPGNVTKGHHYTTEAKDQRGIWMTIPHGQTVSSRIPAGSGKKIYYQQSDKVRPKVDIWLSETPGGESLGRYCQTLGQNFTPKVKFRTDDRIFAWGTCKLQSGRDYYVNIKHTDPEQPASRINRKIYD